MNRPISRLDTLTAELPDAYWTITVTEPLPECPSVEAGWEKIAAQTKWGEWRSESALRKNVTTLVIPPAVEPLQTGDAYIVKVGRFLRIHCRVLESSKPATPDIGNMVFDASGTALGGLVRAHFRFTIFRDDNGIVTACAQEKIMSFPFLTPSKIILESEHRQTLRDLNRSFLAPTR